VRSPIAEEETLADFFHSIGLLKQSYEKKKVESVRFHERMFRELRQTLKEAGKEGERGREESPRRAHARGKGGERERAKSECEEQNAREVSSSFPRR
jgi:hypothetical protein